MQITHHATSPRLLHSKLPRGARAPQCASMYGLVGFNGGANQSRCASTATLLQEGCHHCNTLRYRSTHMKVGIVDNHVLFQHARAFSAHESTAALLHIARQTSWTTHSWHSLRRPLHLFTIIAFLTPFVCVLFLRVV